MTPEIYAIPGPAGSRKIIFHPLGTPPTGYQLAWCDPAPDELAAVRRALAAMPPDCLHDVMTFSVTGELLAAYTLPCWDRIRANKLRRRLGWRAPNPTDPEPWWHVIAGGLLFAAILIILSWLAAL